MRPSQLSAWELSHSSPVTTNWKISCLKCRNSTGMSAVHNQLKDSAAGVSCPGLLTTIAAFQGNLNALLGFPTGQEEPAALALLCDTSG